MGSVMHQKLESEPTLNWRGLRREFSIMTQPDKTSIVTGASRGFGAAIAERLANDGFDVFVNCSGSQAAADAVVNKIETTGGRACRTQTEMPNTAAVTRMLDDAIGTFSAVDLVVSNGGIMKLAELS